MTAKIIFDDGDTSVLDEFNCGVLELELGGHTSDKERTKMVKAHNAIHPTRDMGCSFKEERDLKSIKFDIWEIINSGMHI